MERLVAFEPAFSAPLRSAQTRDPLDLVGPLRPKRSLRETASSTCHSDTKKGYLAVSFFVSMRLDLNQRPLRAG